MKAFRAQLSRSNNEPTMAAPARAPTLDSINGQLESLGLEAQSSRRESQEPPPYSETLETNALSLESGPSASPAKKQEGGLSVVDAKQDEQLAEEQLLDAATAFADAAGGSSSEFEGLPRLDKPILVPRVHPGPTMPFVRAWAPLLESQAISQADFLSFIDGLNLVCAPHAAIKLIEVVAAGIGMVPIDWAEGLSGGLQGVAVLSAIALAHARRQRYLARLNDTVFRPRGLHVRVIGTGKMRKVLGITKDEQLILPLTTESADLSVQERCLRQLERWAAALHVRDLPRPGPSANWVVKFSSWQVRRQTGKFNKQALKSRRRSLKRVAKGKALRENGLEKLRVRMVSWILVENLDDYEKELEEQRRRKAEKKGKKPATEKA